MITISFIDLNLQVHRQLTGTLSYLNGDFHKQVLVKFPIFLLRNPTPSDVLGYIDSENKQNDKRTKQDFSIMFFSDNASLYVKSVVLLLSLFKNKFRKLCLKFSFISRLCFWGEVNYFRHDRKTLNILLSLKVVTNIYGPLLMFMQFLQNKMPVEFYFNPTLHKLFDQYTWGRQKCPLN